MVRVRQHYGLAFYYQVLVRKVMLDLHHHILVQFHSELSVTSALNDTYWYYTEIFEVLMVVYRVHVITS